MKIKVPWSICAISESYHCGHNISELFGVLPNISFVPSDFERDYQ